MCHHSGGKRELSNVGDGIHSIDMKRYEMIEKKKRNRERGIRVGSYHLAPGEEKRGAVKVNKGARERNSSTRWMVGS